MAKVLYIKANAKKHGQSRTFKISDAFIEKYKELNPNDEIITLDLYDEGIGFLPQNELEAIHSNHDGDGSHHPVLKYAYQFRDADKYVVAAPFWNLSFPAILKAYLDYVTISGITFKYTANGPVGLTKGDKVAYFVSRGGQYDCEPLCDLEMGERYLRVIFRFLGINQFTTISANGLDIIGNDANSLVEKAINQGLELATSF